MEIRRNNDEIIEYLSRASDLLKRHNENLHELIRDLPQAVDFLMTGLNLADLGDETRAFDVECEAAKPRLATIANILDRYIVALDHECNRLDKLGWPPESPPHLFGEELDFK